MKKKSFTLLELLLVTIVVAIFATLGYPAYRNMLESANDKVCQTNQKALAAAVRIEVMETDIVPADLSRLSPQSLEKAYAQILKRKGAWKIKLAYLIVGLKERGLAYAGRLLTDAAGGNLRLLTCPLDKTPPAEGGISYALNAAIADKDRQTFACFEETGAALIGDCDAVADKKLIFPATSELPSNAAYRHTHYKNFIRRDNKAFFSNSQGEIMEYAYDSTADGLTFITGNHYIDVCKNNRYNRPQKCWADYGWTSTGIIDLVALKACIVTRKGNLKICLDGCPH